MRSLEKTDSSVATPVATAFITHDRPHRSEDATVLFIFV